MGRLQKNIFLIGFMGVGKSTISYGLKRLLGADVRCMEMDEMIVKQQGMSIAEIFAKHGEDYFRNLESRLLLDLQKQQGVIVSCGGGVVVREENISHMKKNGTIVLLTAKPETIYARVKDSTARPLLNSDMSVAHISELMEARRTKYEAAADVVISTDGKSTDAICDELLRKLGI
jgi:shikimate kinase